MTAKPYETRSKATPRGRGAEVQLSHNDLEFGTTGLRADSLVRLDKLVTLTRTTVARRLGSVGPITLKAIRLAMGRVF
jgi:hypothetical protein